MCFVITPAAIFLNGRRGDSMGWLTCPPVVSPWQTKLHAAKILELDPNTRLSSEDPALAAVLINHVKTVFSDYDGKVGMDG